MTADNSVLTISDMPLCIGSYPKPHNPAGLPDTYPITVLKDPELSAIRLQDSSEMASILDQSYKLGLEMGTPVSEGDLGVGYAQDFFKAISDLDLTAGRVLEIGAGVGYVSHLLMKQGWNVDSLEPGTGYEAHWERYGIEVINDFFPSEKAKGPYDLIVSYAVLEHISDPVKFLKDIATHLTPGGTLLLAVPDCTEEILNGDPGMLLHEHYYYYTQQSLANCLVKAGFSCNVSNAGYGRLLYAKATFGGDGHISKGVHEEDEALNAYMVRCGTFIEVARAKIEAGIAKGDVGIFCPARALAILPHTDGMRFFDDSPSLQGKYYPPFSARVESRKELLSNPPRELWIMSRTFGEQIRKELSVELRGVEIRTIDEILL